MSKETNPLIAKYQKFVSNLEWHLKTNPDKEKEATTLRLGVYKEVLSDLQSQSLPEPEGEKSLQEKYNLLEKDFKWLLGYYAEHEGLTEQEAEKWTASISPQFKQSLQPDGKDREAAITQKVKADSRLYDPGERTIFTDGAETVLREIRGAMLFDREKECKSFANWLSNTVIAGRTIDKLWNDYINEIK